MGTCESKHKTKQVDNPQRVVADDNPQELVATTIEQFLPVTAVCHLIADYARTDLVWIRWSAADVGLVVDKTLLVHTPALAKRAQKEWDICVKGVFQDENKAQDCAFL